MHNKLEKTINQFNIRNKLMLIWSTSAAMQAKSIYIIGLVNLELLLLLQTAETCYNLVYIYQIAFNLMV